MRRFFEVIEGITGLFFLATLAVTPVSFVLAFLKVTGRM